MAMERRRTIGRSRMSRDGGVVAPVVAEPKTSQDCEALVPSHYRVSVVAAAGVADGRLVIAQFCGLKI